MLRISNAYRENTLVELRRQLEAARPSANALDFGSGDGWFAQEVSATGIVREVVCIDVMRRAHSFVEPMLYDGRRLPFEDRSFEIVYAVDVLHHTPSPDATLRDVLRCCRGTFVLKDHNYHRPAHKLVLAALDELGNRRLGVPTVYEYQRNWEWLPIIEDEGFVRRDLRHPIVCETRPLLSRFVNGFQFIGRWERLR